MKIDKILITGADGFIGSHLTELLVSKGYKVRALSQYNSFNNWGWLENINCIKEVEVVIGDIRDPFFCDTITKDIDIVFHLAALIAIPYSYISPQSYIETNVLGTLNICQSSIKNCIKRLIITSTSEVYGTAKYVPIDECHPLQPQSPYSASKIGADSIAMSYFYSFNLPLTIARPFNTYGPRQSARAVIPSIISQIASGKKQIFLGDLTPTRDFNFVTDTCLGLLELALNVNTIGEVINLGSNSEISIGDTFKLIRNLMNSDVELNYDENRMRPKNSEVFRLWCDNSKMIKITGFVPLYDIKRGLIETIDWYSNKENLVNFKSNLYNI
jgi:NAD dependent epimerase/dehydratase